jgi:6-phosphofructokinase
LNQAADREDRQPRMNPADLVASVAHAGAWSGPLSAVDRLLATRLGTAGADRVADGQFGVMVTASGDDTRPDPLAEVAGIRRTIPRDHS